MIQFKIFQRHPAQGPVLDSLQGGRLIEKRDAEIFFEKLQNDMHAAKDVYKRQVLSYLIVTRGEILLFINQETLNEEVRTYLAGLGVKLYDYNDIYQVVPSFKNETVMLEKAHVNYAVCQSPVSYTHL